MLNYKDATLPLNNRQQADIKLAYTIILLVHLL